MPHYNPFVPPRDSDKFPPIKKDKNITRHSYTKKFQVGYCCFNLNKAELLQEGIFFLIHSFARDVLAMKMLEIQKSKFMSVLKVEYKVALLSFFDFQLFH